MRLNYTLAGLFSALTGVALFILLKGDGIGLASMTMRWLAVAGIVILFLLVVIAYIVAGRHARRKAALREIGTAKIEHAPPPSEPAYDPLRLLADHLQARHGHR